MKWIYAIAFPFISVGLMKDIVFLLTDLHPVRKSSIIMVFMIVLVLSVKYSAESIRDLRSESHDN